MENGILYTFSTIAQALGGAFALLSAFVLYRFQSLDNSMWDDSGTLRAGLTAGGGDVFGIDTLRAEGKYGEVLHDVDAVVARQPFRSNPLFDLEVTISLHRFRESVSRYKLLAKAFEQSAWLTGGVMFGSVAIIPFAHLVYSVALLSWSILVIGVIGFAYCLYMYWVVIRAAVFRH